MNWLRVVLRAVLIRHIPLRILVTTDEEYCPTNRDVWMLKSECRECDTHERSTR